MHVSKKRGITRCSICQRDKFKAILEQKNSHELCGIDACNFKTEIEEQLAKPSIQIIAKPKKIIQINKKI